MRFVNNLFIVALFTAILAITFTLAVESQNKTLILGDIIDSDGDPISNVKVTAICNDNTEEYTTSSSGAYTVLFDSELCDSGDNVLIKAEKTGYQSASDDANVEVRECTGELDDICKSKSTELEVIFNIAIKSLSLDIDVPAPVKPSNSGSSGSSSKKTSKSTSGVPQYSQLNITNSTNSTNQENSTNTTNRTSSVSSGINIEVKPQPEEPKSSGITGAVIGSVGGKTNAALIIIFILVVLVGSLYLRKKKKEFASA